MRVDSTHTAHEITLLLIVGCRLTADVERHRQAKDAAEAVSKAAQAAAGAAERALREEEEQRGQAQHRLLEAQQAAAEAQQAAEQREQQAQALEAKLQVGREGREKHHGMWLHGMALVGKLRCVAT